MNPVVYWVSCPLFYYTNIEYTRWPPIPMLFDVNRDQLTSIGLKQHQA